VQQDAEIQNYKGATIKRNHALWTVSLIFLLVHFQQGTASIIRLALSKTVYFEIGSGYILTIVICPF
jgi:hypothetical protein